jgi:hypothetical protein
LQKWEQYVQLDWLGVFFVKREKPVAKNVLF